MLGNVSVAINVYELSKFCAVHLQNYVIMPKSRMLMLIVRYYQFEKIFQDSVVEPLWTSTSKAFYFLTAFRTSSQVNFKTYAGGTFYVTKTGETAFFSWISWVLTYAGGKNKYRNLRLIQIAILRLTFNSSSCLWTIYTIKYENNISIIPKLLPKLSLFRIHENHMIMSFHSLKCSLRQSSDSKIHNLSTFRQLK